MNAKNKRRTPGNTINWAGLMVIVAFLLGTVGVTVAQSTDRDHPTPLTSDEIKGAGTGKKVEYYYSFTGGPGQVLLTIDLSNAEIEVFDPSGFPIDEGIRGIRKGATE